MPDMKFMMIFQGVDRASNVMKKMMAGSKAMNAAAKADAAQSAAQANKQATAFNRVGTAARSAFSSVQRGAATASRSMAALHQKTIKLGRDGLDQVRAGAGKTMRGVGLALGVGAAVAGGASLVANQFLGTAKAFESYNIQLETLEGSAAKGQKAMAWISKFAVDTPLQLDQVVESYRNLKTFGMDPTNGTLQALTDTMAASGKGAEHLDGLILAFGQSWTKGKLQGEEALQMLERGIPVWDILSQKYGKTAAELQEMASKGKLGREAITALIDAVGKKNAGASVKMAKTWEGIAGNLTDAWQRFELAVMNAGLFDFMKSKAQLALDLVNRMAGDGTLDAWAKTVSQRIITVLEATWQFGVGVYGVLQKLGGYLSIAADYVGGWENLAYVLGAIAFAPMLISTAAGIAQIAVGLSMLGAALMANPIALAITAIAVAALRIYMNWEPIKAFFIDLWTSISSGAQAAYAAVTEWLGFDPMAAISAGWSNVSSAFSTIWNNLPPLNWDTVLTALNWASYLHPIRWLEFIPGFSWSGVISGALDWGSYITSLDWLEYLPEFAWPELPAFSWPELPMLDLPELPDLAGWIGAFGDRAMAAIESVSARVGAAWGKVKSVFSFGAEKTPEMQLADPATIRATQASVASLKADMQAVTTINTGPAMAQLGALEAAGGRVKASVISSLTQAQAFVSGMSFYNQGAALMDTMAAGIRARAAVVTIEIQKMAQQVRNMLPSSPAKTGPLSDIHRLKFGETIASSIRAAPMVKAMRAATAATMAAATPMAPAYAMPRIAAAAPAVDQAKARTEVARLRAASTAPVTVHLEYKPTMNLSGDAKTAQADFARQLQEHSRELERIAGEAARRAARRNY